MLSIHYKADHLKQFKVDYLVFSEYEVLYVLMLVFQESSTLREDFCELI